MMEKLIISLSLLTVSLISFAQIDVRGVNICHDKNRKLSCIEKDGYRIDFLNGHFSGFSTTDNMLQFDDATKMFTIKNIAPKRTTDSLVSIQIIKEGPILKNRDSTVFLSKLDHPGITDIDASITDFF